MVKKYLPGTIVIIIAFFAARYLFLPGFVPTHDGEYHIIRFWQFDKVFRSGKLLPRWAPDLDKGRGVPLFAFFYPLPDYIAEVFILLGFSYVRTVHFVLASGLILSGMTFYLWMQSLFNPWPAAVGAVFYILAPYHLVDVFIRGSVGEVWALALAPLVCYFTTELVKKTNQRNLFALNSLALSALLLSHNILGPVFYLFGLLYGIVLYFALPTDSLREVAGILSSYTIGLMLAAFFWLPVVFERKYVTGLKIIDPSDHFPQLYQLLIPAWGSGFSGEYSNNQMSFQIGIPNLLVALLAIGLLFLRKKKDILLILLLAVFGTGLFLMLGSSKFIWQALPLLQYFQFPWRLLALIVFVTAFFAAQAASLGGRMLIGLLIALALLFYLPYTKAVLYKSRPDSYYLANPIWTEGTATLGNSFKVKEGKMEQLQHSNWQTIGQRVTLLSGLLLVIIVKRK